jgi:hypothetical protein
MAPAAPRRLSLEPFLSRVLALTPTKIVVFLGAHVKTRPTSDSDQFVKSVGRGEAAMKLHAPPPPLPLPPFDQAFSRTCGYVNDAP